LFQSYLWSSKRDLSKIDEVDSHMWGSRVGQRFFLCYVCPGSEELPRVLPKTAAIETDRTAYIQECHRSLICRDSVAMSIYALILNQTASPSMPYIKHPSFEEPADENVTIWRYMELSKLNWMLSHNALYFARGDRFKDPYEGQLPPTVMTQIESNNPDPSVPEMWKQFGRNTQFETYLNCWCMQDHESADMWERFAATNGVAIVSSYSRLRESLAESPLEIHIGIVRYGDDHLIHRETMGNGFDYWLWKRKAFSSEKEIRALASIPSNEAGVLVKKSGQPYKAIGWSTLRGDETPTSLAITINIPRLVSRIVLSPTANPQLVSTISNLAKQNGLDCAVEQSDLYTRPY
jgi:hypothetical protein